ncbi:RES family NAD+ phosphorylase [Brenneria populi subsp. brevivirga]|uniref:RES family NAD+ phosphorylase n=1 Tax=Brenneria populi TaxID=1505588 RepID=UPI002E175C2D|nr:RES family NAD+ phosphorylase [Brenneria populi subsp. brevivirga]
MKLYRLTKTKFRATAWTGYGARLAGGRWNSIGTAMVYTSGTASLTLLETLIHLNSAQLLDSFSLLQVDVPDGLIQAVNLNLLPHDWGAEKAPPELAVYGDAWIDSRESVALQVPSAVCPVEFNYLLNPDHPDYKHIIATEKNIPFQFDTRLKSPL